MVNMVQKKVKNHLSKNELNNIIKDLKNNCKMYKKFVLIIAVNDGKKVSEACHFLKISEPTGHRWLDLYNEKGPEGLNPNYQNCGRYSEMSDEQLDDFSKIIENEDYLTAQRAHEIIKNRYGIDYSISNVKKILDKMEYNKGKPYQKYSKRPKNAEEMLKKT
ncbi:MAG: helix-turn-helix domain-containing protein [Methanobrevibacter sp.]|nr:helix-turn-helix domain-containing protein [Methanobrevibacter sp.]